MPEETKPKVEEKTDEKKPAEMTEEPPVVTKHSAAGLKYSVTTGRMPLKDDEGEIVAQVFYMAYTLDGVKDSAKRPLMFSFNGGPGSPSLWLHLGALGPKRVQMGEEGGMPPSPYHLVENPHNWLQFTDLVFIDPVGTGYSRAKTKEQAEKYWSLKGDIESVAEFIRMYLVRNARWASSLYLVGESYGTTRAAGLAGYLVDRGVAFNGVLLVSSVLNFQTGRFNKGNDLPYVLFLPTYTATAWYHGRLNGRLAEDLQRTLDEVEAWAIGPYASALAQGDRLSSSDRKRVARRLAAFTGLSLDFVEQADLRINISKFCKELLRDERRTVGRLDSRFKGIDDHSRAYAEDPQHDPSMTMLMPPYTAMLNQYVRTELGYETDLPYEIFGGIKKPWEWGNAGDGHPDTSEALRAAMSKNPFMKVYVASGYFDLATPYFATEYTLAHMGLDPAVRDNVTLGEFPAGHMMYVHEPSLERFCAEARAFVEATKNV